ncbi:M56 family metallopeptidase [Actinomadura sp. NAK00032]|uniref:M56 family metallopeptidase n=1 Tax=Actinomadura sp. NAK00032 TaxID=2742128 RepID=UPI0015911CB9|nr:M56 family metallopeptidase [Actinomadura sp. NAK00032]QKW33147.1 M56 family metallopeptidase [Actinomadura sp. NAK00032]
MTRHDPVIFLVGALIASAALLGCLAGPVLDRIRGGALGPRTAVACWTAALAGTVIASSGVVAVALISPPGPAHGLLTMLRDCLPHHGSEAMIMAAGASLVLLTACGARLARGASRLVRALRHRRRHWEMLHLVARQHAGHADVLVLDHPAPVAYSLSARRRAIVLSTRAQDVLSAAELGAVLAHERAHLRQRHHALLLVLDVAHALLPWLPTVRRARARLPLLLEMAADDTAARTHGPQTLVQALCRLTPNALATPGSLSATGPLPAPGPLGTSGVGLGGGGGLGAVGGSGADGLAARLRRLESGEPAQPRGLFRVVAPLFVGAAVAGPLTGAALAVGRLAVLC